MQNPCPRRPLSRGKLPLLRCLHGLPGKVFTRACGNEVGVLYIARGIHQNFYPDPDGAADRVLRRLGHRPAKLAAELRLDWSFRRMLCWPLQQVRARSRSLGTLALIARSRRRRFGCIRGWRLRRSGGALGFRQSHRRRRNRWCRGNRTRWLSVGTAVQQLGTEPQSGHSQYHRGDKKNVAPLGGPRGYPDRRRLRRTRWCGLQPGSDIRHRAAALGIKAQTAMGDSHERRRHSLRQRFRQCPRRRAGAG